MDKSCHGFKRTNLNNLGPIKMQKCDIGPLGIVRYLWGMTGSGKKLPGSGIFFLVPNIV